MDWYFTDFGKTKKDVILWISKYLPPKKSELLTKLVEDEFFIQVISLFLYFFI